ncbi:hypothetical protein I553_0975 [Mycobacterium xenopi 4042]|uniref:DUF7159 domain-containing protein n=1 Tax=Mycobacterium xenopi 4042 TaxID=1299334 RepID=X7ZBN2_MYCXE|nr:hypothetical protein I553_0975 [Mycobacterium xenopi 4042]
MLVEGENADGATVDEDHFEVAVDGDSATAAAADQVIAAILGTREAALEAGYQLTSTGVTWTDAQDAPVLRDALDSRQIDGVMLVGPLLATAALAQTVGTALGYEHIALLFVEPRSATLAVVNCADGSIVDLRRRLVNTVWGEGDTAELAADAAELTSMVCGLESLESRPQGVFIVGCGVDVVPIKQRLEEATTLPVSVPEEPDTALARGAALASANAPLFASSTAALAYAQDPGTGEVDQYAVARPTWTFPGRPAQRAGHWRIARCLTSSRSSPAATPADSTGRHCCGGSVVDWRCGAGCFAGRRCAADGRSATPTGGVWSSRPNRRGATDRATACAAASAPPAAPPPVASPAPAASPAPPTAAPSPPPETIPEPAPVVAPHPAPVHRTPAPQAPASQAPAPSTRIRGARRPAPQPRRRRASTPAAPPPRHSGRAATAASSACNAADDDVSAATVRHGADPDQSAPPAPPPDPSSHLRHTAARGTTSRAARTLRVTGAAEGLCDARRRWVRIRSRRFRSSNPRGGRRTARPVRADRQILDRAGDRAGWSVFFEDMARRSRREPETTGETGDGSG